MAVSRIKTWIAGEVLTASDLNSEFNNIINAGAPLVSPLTAAWDLDGQTLILDGDADTSINSNTDDRLDMVVNGAVVQRLTASTVTLPSGNSQVVTSGDISFTAGRLIEAALTSLASATVVTLPTTSNNFTLTGTTDISAFSTTAAGYRFTCRYTGTGLNLIHNSTSLILPYGTDYRLTTDEIVTFFSLGSGNYILETRSNSSMPPGTMVPTPTVTADTGFLLADGSTVNASTYRALAKKLIPNAADFGRGGAVGNPVTDALTDTMTLIGHGLAHNDVIHFANTGGALPTPLLTETAYYLIFSTPSTFQVAATYGGAAIDLTSAGSGTTSLYNLFVLPDLRGRYPLGADNMGGVGVNRVTATEADNLGQGAGSETISIANLPAHTHPGTATWNITNGAGGNVARPPNSNNSTTAGGDTATTVTGFTAPSQGDGTAYMTPYQTLNWQIRY